MTVFSSGISMYAMGKLFNLLLGWSFNISVLVSAAIVLAYVTLGGLTSAIYNEVLQFFLIVFGFAPLVLLGLHSVGGWDGLTAKLSATVADRAGSRRARTRTRGRTWATPATNPIGVEWFGLVMGLGFVLSFGYWCTDFLVVQRAMAADSMTAARRTPLIAAFPKMLFPFLVILPGMIALALTVGARGPGTAGMIPAKLAANGAPLDRQRGPRGARLRPRDADDARAAASRPACSGSASRRCSRRSCRGWRGTSPRSTPCGRTTSTRATSSRGASDAHYLWMGRVATVGGILLSIAAAYVAGSFNNIMDLLQLVFAFVNAPLFATFALGMFWKRTTGHGAFLGLLAGTIGAAVHHGLTLPAGAARRREGRLLRPDAHVSERAGADVLDGDRRRGRPASSSPSS